MNTTAFKKLSQGSVPRGTVPEPVGARRARKAYKGFGMEGWIAEWYTNLTRKDLPEFQVLARRIAGDLAVGARILEVAPGPGFLAVELAKAGTFEITGLDISRSLVDIARQNAAREGVAVKFRQGNAADMPFPSDRFDRIVCRAAFKNFAEPVEALKEMHRVLKPGGKALIVDLRKDTPMSSINAYADGLRVSLASRLFTKLIFRTTLLRRAYTMQQFQELVSQSGLSKSSDSTSGLGFEVWLEK